MEGDKNSITVKRGAGIFVKEGSTVNITSSDREKVLRVEGAQGYGAIGGFGETNEESGVVCGNISISGVSVYARFWNMNGLGFATVGGCNLASYGTITINNATVYAYNDAFIYNNYAIPAIGLGRYATNPGTMHDTTPVITITDSEIHVRRNGTYADYIGRPQNTDSTAIDFGSDGFAKNSITYCYMGLDAVDYDKIVIHDADGNVLNTC